MKRPLLVIGVSFAIATWASFLLLEDVSWRFSAILAALGAAAGLPRRHRLHRVSVALLAAALAVGAHALHHVRRIEPLQALDGEYVEITGVITGTRAYPGAVDYTVLAAFPDRPELPQRSTLRVRAYEMEFRTGDVMHATVRISELTGSRAGFYASGVFVRAVLMEGKSPAVGPYEYTRLAVNQREGMRGRIHSRLNGEAAAMISGMVLGATEDLPDEDYSALNRSGISHLLSVSGLHLSVLTGCVLGLLRRLRCPRMAAHLIAVFAGFLFAMVVGFSPSILRALLMLGIFLVASAVARDSDSLNALALSLLIICVLYPHWVLSRGLWLSFASTAGIIVFAGPLQARIKAWVTRRRGRPPGKAAGVFIGAFAVTCSAYVFSTPIIVLTSGCFSIISPYANVLVAPLIFPALAGGLLCGLLPLRVPLGALVWLVEWCAGTILRIARLLGGLPFAVFSVDELYLLIWVVGAFAMLVLLVRRRAGQRQVAVAVALCLFCLSAGGLSMRVFARGTVEVVTVDGCGQAILLQDGAAVIIGTPTQYDIGALTRYLEFRGVRDVAAVVATDSGDQVTSGLRQLCGSYEVGCVFGPDDEFVLEQLGGLLDVPVYAGGHAEIQVLRGVTLSTRGDGLTVDIRVGDLQVRKTSVIYGILGFDDPDVLAYVYDDGTMRWPDSHPPALEPMGFMLFGETRLIL